MTQPALPPLSTTWTATPSTSHVVGGSPPQPPLPPTAPPVPPMPPPPSRIDALLGDTSGTQDGNVRAIVTVLGVLGAHALVLLLIVEYCLGNAGSLKDLVTALTPTLVTADVGYGAYYFGHRAGEQAAK